MGAYEMSAAMANAIKEYEAALRSGLSRVKARLGLIAIGLGVSERLYPVYELGMAKQNRAYVLVYRGVLDTLWSIPEKEKLAHLESEIERIMPDSEENIVGEYDVTVDEMQNAIMSLYYNISFFRDNNIDSIVKACKSSIECIYIYLTAVEIRERGIPLLGREIDNERYYRSPMVVKEVRRQLCDIDWLTASRLDPCLSA